MCGRRRGLDLYRGNFQESNCELNLAQRYLLRTTSTAIIGQRLGVSIRHRLLEKGGGGCQNIPRCRQFKFSKFEERSGPSVLWDKEQSFHLLFFTSLIEHSARIFIIYSNNIFLHLLGKLFCFLVDCT